MCALFYLGAGAAEVGGKSAPQHADVGGQDKLVKTHVDHARNLHGRDCVHGRGDAGSVARLDDPAQRLVEISVRAIHAEAEAQAEVDRTDMDATNPRHGGDLGDTV